MPRRVHILAFLASLSFGLASLSGVRVEPDERKIDPVLLAIDAPAVVAMQRKCAGSPVRAQANVPLFFRLGSEDPAFPDRVRMLGGTARKVGNRLYTGHIPRDAARYLSNRPEVAYLEAAKRARPLLDISAPAVSAGTVQVGSANWPPPFNAGIRGVDNVYVGIVDTGLDNAHLDFHTGGTGSPSRVVHTYSSPQLPLLNPPLSPDPLVDEEGHGTHVTGIAAGNGFSSSGTYTGMAPQSPILFGKTSFFTTDIVIAVTDLLTYAETIPVPVSINLSLGLSTGPHDGTSGFESFIDSLSVGTPGSRRLIAVSAGNERKDKEHFRTTLAPFGIATAFLTLEDISGATAEIWADGEDQYTVTATLGGESATVASGVFGSSGGGRISVSNKRATPPNGATFISIFFLPQSSGQAANIRLTRTRNGGTGRVDGYIDSPEGTFDPPATESGTVTEPANAENVIAVGSFNSKLDTRFGTETLDAISSFSSLGPTRDGKTKPDLAAPGWVIYSARSSAPTATYFDNVASNYAILAGTSMAAPHVTGIAALVWESNPALTGAQMRERLKKTADPQPVGSISLNNTWGHGKVNALRAVTEAVAGITIVPPPGVSVNAIPPGTPVTLKGDEKSSGPFDNSISYSWDNGTGGTLTSFAGPQTTFSASTPGNYDIALTVEPGNVPYKSAMATLHVNALPIAAIDGPSSSDTLDPVSFSGLSSVDPDGGSLSFHWILVSKPTASPPGLLTPVAPDNTAATLSPDVAGTYEVGLRVDDGLDNSALAVHSFTIPTPGNGGGGGCSILAFGSRERTHTHLIEPVLFLLPPAFLGIPGLIRKRIPSRKR